MRCEQDIGPNWPVGPIAGRFLLCRDGLPVAGAATRESALSLAAEMIDEAPEDDVSIYEAATGIHLNVPRSGFIALAGEAA